MLDEGIRKEGTLVDVRQFDSSIKYRLLTNEVFYVPRKEHKKLFSINFIFLFQIKFKGFLFSFYFCIKKQPE